MLPTFDIANSARNAYGAHICTINDIDALQTSVIVAENCRLATEGMATWTEDTPADETARMKDAVKDYKLRLPVILPHAHFSDGHRCNESAVPSGLMSMDFDHIKDPRKFWLTIEPKKDALHILWAFISPTFTGVKIISVKPSNLSMEDAQAWFAEQVGAEEYDHTHDLARCVYLVPKEYNLHYRPDLLFGDVEEFSVDWDAERPIASVVVGNDQPISEKQFLQELEGVDFNPKAKFYGVPYSEIAKAFWMKKLGHYPEEGMRHAALREWVLEGASICEFDARKLMEVTPRLGKDAKEVARLIMDVLGWKKNFRPTMPYTLNKVLKELNVGAVDKGTPFVDMLAFNKQFLDRMPILPKPLRACLYGVDEKYHMAIICGMLPAFCSFAEKVVYRHCDGGIRRPTLYSFIVGESGSGKDNITQKLKLLLADQDADDTQARDDNDAIRENNLNKSADERGKKEMNFVKQRALNITSADLLNWMKVSRKLGKKVAGRSMPRKILMFTSEAGNVRTAIRDAALMAAWRQGFDGDKMSADRYSASAVSGSEEVSIDIIAECTPGVLKSLIGSDSQEDGTASRLLISFVPGDAFAPMPMKKEVDQSIRNQMLEGAYLCQQFEGLIDNPRLRNSLREWSDNVGNECRETNDKKRAMLRRRSVIMGMCAAVIFAILENRYDDKGTLRVSPSAVRFGLIIAEYAMETSAAVFSDYAENAAVEFSLRGVYKETKNKVFFDQLPELFTREDILKLNSNMSTSAATTWISRLKSEDKIVKVSKSEYRKLTNSESNNGSALT